MITRVLVANRGEIARRVFATCRALGIGTVAVYTDPDAASPHVAEADARVRLEGTRGYLDSAQLIAAARAAGADAVHPGYGFLSENAEFAAAVDDAGLTWIGPPVAAVAAMGSKIEAKKMMAAAGVPVLEELDPDTVTADQLPVLIKASAGGGGRGMRVVDDLSALSGQVEAARREAQSAFGDPTVFCERYLATGHHVEVQVMADQHRQLVGGDGVGVEFLEHRDARGRHHLLRLDLGAHRGDRGHRRTDPRQPGIAHRGGEFSVLREESVSGMDRVGVGGFRGGDQLRGVQVASGSFETHPGVGLRDVRRRGVGIGVDGDCADAQLAARGKDAAGDLAAIGDQHSSDHDVTS